MPTSFPDPNSVVDTLKSTSQPSDYYSRSSMYGALGLPGGTPAYIAAGSNNAPQNIALNGAIKSNATPPPTPPPSGGATGNASGIKSNTYNSDGSTTVTHNDGTVETIPAPGGSSTPGGDRYSRYTQAEQSYQTALNDRNPTPDQLAEKQRQIQEVTDTINAEYNKLFASEGQAGQERSDKTRALNIAAGLGGSDFGSAAAIKTDTTNKAQMDLLTQEKAAKLADAITGVETRMSDQFRQQRADELAAAQGNMNLEKQYIDESKQKATDSIKTIAGSGVSLTQFKNQQPEMWQQLVTEYGSAPEAEAFYNSSLPSNMQVQYDSKIIQGQNGNAVLFQYGVNPVTGTIDKKEYDLGQNYNSYAGVKPISVGGNFYSQQPDGSLKKLTFNTGSGSSTGTYTSGGLSLSKSQLGQISTELENSKNTPNTSAGIPGDGVYVNPELYQATYEDWVKNGGLAKDFLTQFPPSKYVNPANDTLPTYLRSTQPSKAKSSTATGSSTTPGGRVTP